MSDGVLDLKDIFISRESVSRLEQIIGKLDGIVSDLEQISNKLRAELETEVLDERRVKLYDRVIARLLQSLELLGKYTGDLKNRNENLNINIDYSEALRLFISLLPEVTTDSQRKKLVSLYREKGGSLLIRDR